MSNDRRPLPTDPKDAAYLGDGAYIRADEAEGLILYTSDGEAETNRIYLGPTEGLVLYHYLDQWKHHGGTFTAEELTTLARYMEKARHDAAGRRRS